VRRKTPNPLPGNILKLNPYVDVYLYKDLNHFRGKKLGLVHPPLVPKGSIILTLQMKRIKDGLQTFDMLKVLTPVGLGWVMYFDYNFSGV
jgi:hypothetical protein